MASDFTIYSRYADMAAGDSPTLDFGIGLGSISVVNHGPASVYVKFDGAATSARASNQPKIGPGETLTIPKCLVRTIGLYALSDVAGGASVDVTGQLISQS